MEGSSPFIQKVQSNWGTGTVHRGLGAGFREGGENRESKKMPNNTM